jgi:hypothetical protein
MSIILTSPIVDSRGSLMIWEALSNVPFNISRIFAIYDVKAEEKRGGHAHFESEQFMIALQGECTVELDDGKTKTLIKLDSITKGLLQPAGVWGTMMNFTSDCMLLVVANTIYDESDYIRDYQKFLEYKKNEK